MDEEQLLELKKKIEDAKTEASEIKGQISYLQKELKEKWGCTTPEGTGEKIKTLRAEITSLEEKIEKNANLLIKAVEEFEDDDDD